MPESDPLQPVKQAVASGTLVKLADLLDRIGTVVPEGNPDTPPPAPAPFLDTEVVDAAKRLPEVFGSVVPEKRRTLTPEEIHALYDERAVLSILGKSVESRRESIRTTIYHHFDAQIDTEPERLEHIERDKDGFYLTAEQVDIPDTDQCFKRELREGSPTITEHGLAKLEAEGKITHEQYLAMTAPARVFDENRFMIVLKKNPDLVGVLADAMTPGKKSSQMWPRKRKR